MATQIGSVFLGDVQRHRILSPTPPSSPDPAPTKKFVPAKQPSTSQKPPTITPELSLELRLRWLEALLYGVKPKDKSLAKGETLLGNAQQIQKRLDDLVQNNDSLRKFMDQYDQYAHLLTLSGIIPNALPSYDDMTPSEFETFLQEMEPDIRAADRDMHEIEALDQKGVAAVGKLTNYQSFRPRIEALLEAHKQDIETATSLEKRIAALVRQYGTHVGALSELFVAWDDTIREAEDQVAKLERDQAERRKLGYE